MLRRPWLLLLSLMCAFGPLSAAAAQESEQEPYKNQAPVMVSQAQTHITLSDSVQVYRDVSRIYTLEDLRPAQSRDPFKPGSTDVGNQQAAFWVRLRLHNTDAQSTTWWLDTGNHYLPEIAVFSADAKGQFNKQIAGATRPFADRPLPTPNFVFPLVLPAGQTVDIYVRAYTLGVLSHTLDLKLWQPDAYKAYVRHVEVQWFLFLGLSLGLALFNLFLYFFLKDSNYLIYVATVLAQVWRASDNGIAYEYFWPNSPFFEQVLSRGLSVIAVIAITNLFVCRFIELPRLRPHWYARLNTMQVGIAAMMLISMGAAHFSQTVPLPVFRAAQFLFVVGILAYVLFLLFVLCRWTWTGNRRARALLIAFAPLMVLTGVVEPLLHLLKIDVNWTIPPVMLGAAIEMVLMSVALADRLNEATQAKHNEQRAMLTGLQTKTRELKSHVMQRTQDLAHANQAFQGILENAQDAVVLTDPLGEITHWNKQAVLTFGWTRKEAMGRELTELIFPPHSPPPLVAQLLGQEQQEELTDSPRIETMAIHKNGTEFPIEFAASSINVDGLFEFSFFLRDITQRRKAQADIQASLDRQKELNDLKSRFVAMASHEFRTPLTTILSSTELLRFYSDRMQESERDKLHLSVESAVQRMTHMLSDVLLIGKSDAGMLTCNPEPLDLPVFFNALVAEMQDNPSSGAEQLQRIDLRMDPAVAMGRFDAKLMRHIFTNLLSNAIKYSPPGAPVVCEVSATDIDMVFVVSDQGIGIPTEHLPRLFESFSRAANVGEISGTGLGLAIVKRSVDLHGGTITVDSVLGQGCRFEVRLPMEGAAPA